MSKFYERIGWLNWALSGSFLILMPSEDFVFFGLISASVLAFAASKEETEDSEVTTDE